jgi:hypothetical protein
MCRRFLDDDDYGNGGRAERTDGEVAATNACCPIRNHVSEDHAHDYRRSMPLTASAGGLGTGHDSITLPSIRARKQRCDVNSKSMQLMEVSNLPRLFGVVVYSVNSGPIRGSTLEPRQAIRDRLLTLDAPVEPRSPMRGSGSVSVVQNQPLIPALAVDRGTHQTNGRNRCRQHSGWRRAKAFGCHRPPRNAHPLTVTADERRRTCGAERRDCNSKTLI